MHVWYNVLLCTCHIGKKLLSMGRRKEEGDIEEGKETRERREGKAGEGRKEGGRRQEGDCE